jgi:ribosomal protein S18 acetylase RimI-like enzyme
MTRPTVRRATAADAQDVAAVFAAAVRAGWTFLGPVAQRPMFTPAQWDDLVADLGPPDALLVATDAAGAVIGFAAVRTQEGELYLLFVHPDHAGHGVGRALLDAAHDVLRAAGHSHAYLYTEERNLRALRVYEAAGYRPDGRSRESDFHGVPLRELRLVAALPAGPSAP